ncbi:DUF6493 family protein [Luedemannella flava]
MLAFAELAEEGLVERAMLLDGCLSRFLKGDRPASMGAFVALHDALAPTLDEIAERHEDYARVLPVASGPVATLAQKALRALDDAGRLDAEVVLQAGRDILFRPERGLVRTQLSWLDRTAKRRPAHAADVVRVVAGAFGYPALDMQERALAIVGRHLGACDADVRAELAVAAGSLEADLGARARELLGVGSVDVVAGSWDDPAPPAGAPARRPMPAPIASPAELAAEVTALLSGGADAVAWERVLAATVSLAGDRAALHDCLLPVLERGVSYFHRSHLDHVVLEQFLGLTLRAVIHEPVQDSWRAVVETIGWLATTDKPQEKTWRNVPAPHFLLIRRVAEIGHRIDRQPVPALVATPTSTTGHVDAAVLVERIEAAERAGWEPWPVDFAQALLRLPREADPEAAARAARLTSAAGRRLAARLAAGPPADPVVERAVRRRVRHWWTSQNAEREMPIMRLLPGESTGDPTYDALFHTASAGERWPSWSGSQPLWPAVLPSHREVVAAHLLPDLAIGAELGNDDPARALPVVAECAGPCGPATALALAYALGSARESTRITGVDAALTLAATGDLDGTAIGDALAAQLAAETTKVVRVVTALTELFNAGQSAAAWAIAARILAAVLPSPKAPPGTPDLLALASRAVAGRTDVAPLPELGPVAARTGSSRLVTEARRLQRLLP